MQESYLRGTGVNPSNFGSVHIQIRAYRRRHADDATLEKRLLPDSHGSRQDEETLLERRAKTFRARCVDRLLVDSETDLGAFLLVVFTHGEDQLGRFLAQLRGEERKVGKAETYRLRLRLRREKKLGPRGSSGWVMYGARLKKVGWGLLFFFLKALQLISYI